MGLQITVYKDLHIIKNPKLDIHGFPIDPDTVKFGFIIKLLRKTHPKHVEGLNENYSYKYSDKCRFFAGSYLDYANWRDSLYELRKEDIWAFEELINFSDCEGVINCFTSNKLKEDFEMFMDEAIEYANTIENGKRWFMQYWYWLTAFKFASEYGAVQFN